MFALRQIQRQQSLEDFIVGHDGAVIVPAVGGSDSQGELAARHGRPGRFRVVEAGEGAHWQGFEVLFAQSRFGLDAAGVNFRPYWL